MLQEGRYLLRSAGWWQEFLLPASLADVPF